MQRKWMCSNLVRKYSGIFFDGENEIKKLKIYKLKISFIIYIFFHNKSNKRI